MLAISLTRNNGFYAKARALKIYVDDEMVGSVKAGETISFSVSKDAGVIYAKLDWAKTNSISVSGLIDGSALEANARFSFNPLLMLGIGGLPIRLETTFS